jgi:hypothetical protein
MIQKHGVSRDQICDVSRLMQTAEIRTGLSLIKYSLSLRLHWTRSKQMSDVFMPEFTPSFYMRADSKVRELTLLLRVGTLWRCGDCLFFEVPLLASYALLTTLHPLLENVL